MSDATPSTSPLSKRAGELLADHQRIIWTRTDRLFGALLACEWLAGVLVAAVRSPWTYEGTVRSVHPHLWAATILGAIFVSLPIFMSITRAGARTTRHAVAVSQMLMTGLIIDLADGRIESHFMIFGSFAFLAFYRDWRVLMSGIVIVASDHVLRGLFTPFTVYGVGSASGWRTFEHAFWVVFENIFLIASCAQGVREMRGIAENQALLERSYRDVEQKILERTSELEATQDELLKAARTAGMAEIATSVLHNVGNVLNSVNVSATLVADRIKKSDAPNVGRVSDLLAEHRNDIGTFLTADERGKTIPDFLAQLAGCLNEEQETLLSEVTSLTRGIDHIKQIVVAQQSMAKKSTVHTTIEPARLFETAMAIQASSMPRDVKIIRDFELIGPLELDEHKILQILVNLISNARQAVALNGDAPKQIALGVKRASADTGEATLRLSVSDNGVGIAAENLNRIFAHGFTTKADGHGFGLHSAANAAGEMHGRLTVISDGIGRGATFTLELPIQTVALAAQEAAPCR